MAVFRGITAEEEAATGLFRALTFRNYENANRLKPRDHLHKNAVTPFLRVLGSFFAEFSETPKMSPRLVLKEEDGETRLRTVIQVPVGEEKVLAYPIPPLNFSVTSDGKPPSYKKQIERLLAAEGYQEISRYLKQAANQRNTFLYANPNGYTEIQSLEDRYFTRQKNRVMTMAMAYLLIEPYDECQPFVQQALEAFLVMMDVLESQYLHPEL